MEQTQIDLTRKVTLAEIISAFEEIKIEWKNGELSSLEE